MKIVIVCAWCGKKLGEKDGQGVEGTSHGICDSCLLHHFPHVYEQVHDIIGGPVDDIYQFPEKQ